MARDVQLRSWEQPYGVDGLGGYHAEIVEVGNTLIEFSVKFARDLMEAGWCFSIENPWPCWTRVHRPPMGDMALAERWGDPHHICHAALVGPLR